MHWKPHQTFPTLSLNGENHLFMFYTCSSLASDALRKQHFLQQVISLANMTSQLSSLRRFRQLWQSRISTGCHSGNERVSDRHEAPQSPAQALKERQQTVLILALGPLSCYTARVSPHCCHGYQTGTPGGGGARGGVSPFDDQREPLSRKLLLFVFLLFY